MDKLNKQQIAALAEFKANNGRNWKSTLRRIWMGSSGLDSGTLRQIRNEFGERAFKLFDKQFNAVES